MPDTRAAPADDTVPDDWSRPLVERQLEMLGRLAEVGLEVAIEVERRLKADASMEPQVAAMAYARAARAVRMTLMLQSRLIKELQAREAEAVVEAPPEDAPRRTAEEQAQLDRREGHKARVERIVERVAKAACSNDEDGDDEVERLVYEASERLDDEDVYGEVLERPVGELVALICRDLGLDPDWSRLAQEAWAKAEVADGDLRSPFAALAVGASSLVCGGGGAGGVEGAFRRRHP